MIMDFLSIFILGIVEGVTEFLPISSTGHLILTSNLLNLAPTNFLTSFEICIQLGAILAVFFLYFNKFLKNPKEIFLKILTAFIPTAIIGLALYSFIKQFLLNNSQVVLWSLFIGGVILIIFEQFYHEKESAVSDIKDISYKNCFLIGLFQSLAVVPGVSRAAATIVGGLTLGLKRKTIVEFSFLLAVPTMLAASGLDLIKTGVQFSPSEWWTIFFGALLSCVVAIGAIKFLLNFIQKRSFVVFGVYRIILAIIFWLFIIN